MILKDQKFRKISPLVFQELNSDEDAAKPLEWRRDYRYIYLDVGNINLSLDFKLNELNKSFERDSQGKDTVMTFPEMQASPDFRYRLSGEVVECNDNIYELVELGNQVYSLHKPTKAMRIHINDCGDYVRRDKLFPNGVYDGTIIHCCHEDLDNLSDDIDNEDYFVFDAAVPTNFFERIVDYLKSSKDPIIKLRLALLSYGYEVDDALCEPWMPRNYLVHSNYPCPILRLTVTSKIS